MYLPSDQSIVSGTSKYYVVNSENCMCHTLGADCPPDNDVCLSSKPDQRSLKFQASLDRKLGHINNYEDGYLRTPLREGFFLITEYPEKMSNFLITHSFRLRYFLASTGVSRKSGGRLNGSHSRPPPPQGGSQEAVLTL